MAWLVVVSGACGSGKSTIGQALAQRESAVFIEGDEFHAPENVNKMTRGQPLTDKDRQQWLEALHQQLCQVAAAGGGSERPRRCGVAAVVACSALKRSYRDTLLGRGQGEGDLSGKSVLVQLTAGAALLHTRLAGRTGHFMPASLVSSQLEAMEPLSLDEQPCLTCSSVSSSPADVTQTILDFISSLVQPHTN